MRKRMERILSFLAEQQSETGLTTAEIAEHLMIQRTNTSKDLNALVRQGYVEKVTGRPVRYVCAMKEDVRPQKSVIEHARPHDIFTTMIGHNGSMKNACEQAKAAILYPPKGLNCLITGPTGSGKTFFAHAMFQYAQMNQAVAVDQELIVFNCADYAHNPELLMSHLFGYVKGAFTGAIDEKIGLLEQADGSMLFLDEIHRLPPEGQEMIFYFMDHGTYHRLGETGKHRQASVRIIGATTEDPASALLATFVRRIPINIQLPSFNQRPVSEQIELVRVMVAQEASRIERTISLTDDVVKALIGSVSFGNVGQLKSNVQLVCARAFLNHMQQPQIDITLADLPEAVRAGLLQLASQREQLPELTRYLQPQLIIQPHEETVTLQSDTYELPYNLYNIIGDKAALLKADGVDQAAINHFITTDINVHLKSFYQNHGFSFQTDSKLGEFVDEEILTLTRQLATHVEERCGIDMQRNFIYAMSLHIGALLKKIRDGQQREVNQNIQAMVHEYPETLAVAAELRTMIEEALAIVIPESEIAYLATLLISLQQNPARGKVGVVVAAHGESTATSMADVACRLLNATHVQSVDMPLAMAPKVAFEKMQMAVQQVDEGNGVLLLVDMGSLASFDQELTRTTGVPIQTVELVTTPLVLEAVRKGALVDVDLDELAQSLREFRGYQYERKQQMDETKPQAIIAVCASGLGTAERMKEMIEQFVSRKQLSVLTVALTELPQRLATIQEKYQIVATTGLADPQIGYPFLSIEQLIENDTQQLLQNVVLTSRLTQDDTVMNEQQVCRQFIQENYTFLNAEKVLPALIAFADEVVALFPTLAKKVGFRVHFIVHTAGMLERLALKEPLSADDALIQELPAIPQYATFKKSLRTFAAQFNTEVPDTEEVYLLEWIKQYI